MKDLDEQVDQLLKGEGREAAIRWLTEQAERYPQDEELLLRWGELLYAEGRMTDALNKFNAVLRLNTENRKAANYKTMINNILGYYCKDWLNP